MTVERSTTPRNGRSPSVERETLILDAAQKRFALYGLNKVTMDEIASDVGMGKASLYYYFSTKEDLFKGVIQREQHEFLRRLHEIAVLDLRAGDKLRRYVEQRLRYLKELVNLQLLNIHSWLNSRPVFRDLFESFAAQERKIVTGILRQGRKSGEFRIRSPEVTADLILHVLQGLRLRALRAAQPHDQAADMSREVEREMRQVIELLIRGLQPGHSRRQ
jgi:TetR/AcrR family transcriptional regulator